MKTIIKIMGIIILLSFVCSFNISNASNEFEYRGVAKMEFQNIDEIVEQQANQERTEYINKILETINISLMGLASIFIFWGLKFIRKANKKAGTVLVIIAVIIFLITYIIKILFIHNHEVIA